jgi:hypothetical protein
MKRGREDGRGGGGACGVRRWGFQPWESLGRVCGGDLRVEGGEGARRQAGKGGGASSLILPSPVAR